VKAKKKPLHHNTSDPAKIRENIIQQFESLPTDTRDIIAQFYIMTLSEKLPEWQKQGDKARRAESGKKK
jgi:hypothetical protein